MDDDHAKVAIEAIGRATAPREGRRRGDRA